MEERYRERKNYRHRHFKNHYAGPEDLENVLSKPPNHCTKEAWQLICEMFLSERFLARSAKNQANRRQMKYVTTQGTKSLAAKRHEYENPDAHVVDTWRDAHMRKSTKSFVNEAAQQDYEKMAAEVERSQNERQSQQQSEASLNRHLPPQSEGASSSQSPSQHIKNEKRDLSEQPHQYGDCGGWDEGPSNG
ncbi:uncharacterized protein LOC133799648 [Humulus lupulus]|uniref:uncharacterized protein LOC133799648 n=1 Tax=Humulus lupulus TaxID=3486 RepID=UPI002B413D5A|nr:uncharacterized protein LOC133799648 [Humulus lupulus]